VIAAVAYAYGLTVAEVATWPADVLATFHRAAVAHGWLLPHLEETA